MMSSVLTSRELNRDGAALYCPATECTEGCRHLAVIAKARRQMKRAWRPNSGLPNSIYVEIYIGGDGEKKFEPAGADDPGVGGDAEREQTSGVSRHWAPLLSRTQHTTSSCTGKN